MPFVRMLRGCRCLLLAASTLGPLPGIAQATDFPSKPVRLLVGYAPGSGADVVARLLAGPLQGAFRQGVVVENKPGAGGLLAAQETARAAADGHTLMMGALPQIAVAPAANPKLAYDPARDFAPVAQVVGTDLVLVINPRRVPAASMSEFVAWAQRQPTVFFGTPGPGTVGHLGAYFLGDSERLKIEPVHFKTTADAVTAMLQGDVHAQFVPYAVAAPQVKAGHLIALMTTGPERTSLFPTTPTSREAGYPKVQFTSWYGVFAPAQTPVAVLDRLNAEIVQATRSPETRSRLEEAGLRVTGTTRLEFARLIKDDMARWGDVVRATGFRTQD